MAEHRGPWTAIAAVAVAAMLAAGCGNKAAGNKAGNKAAGSGVSANNRHNGGASIRTSNDGPLGSKTPQFNFNLPPTTKAPPTTIKRRAVHRSHQVRRR